VIMLIFEKSYGKTAKKFYHHFMITTLESYDQIPIKLGVPHCIKETIKLPVMNSRRRR